MTEPPPDAPDISTPPEELTREQLIDRVKFLRAWLENEDGAARHENEMRIALEGRLREMEEREANQLYVGEFYAARTLHYRTFVQRVAQTSPEDVGALSKMIAEAKHVLSTRSDPGPWPSPVPEDIERARQLAIDRNWKDIQP